MAYTGEQMSPWYTLTGKYIPCEGQAMWRFKILQDEEASPRRFPNSVASSLSIRLYTEEWETARFLIKSGSNF